MLAQRIHGLALGYEDLNDHEELRHDPLLALLAGKREIAEPLAGKSTLNRLELAPAGAQSGIAERFHKISYSAEAIDALLVDLFLEAHAKDPREMVLDLDTTDTPLRGRQEDRFFHDYYNHDCYVPLYIFCREHLLCARLRPSNIDASAGGPGHPPDGHEIEPRPSASSYSVPAILINLLATVSNSRVDRSNSSI